MIKNIICKKLLKFQENYRKLENYFAANSDLDDRFHPTQFFCQDIIGKEKMIEIIYL